MVKKNYISILITNYNKEKFLNRNLKNACNQNFKNYEIIVFDDCSTDKSVNIIKKYKKVSLIINNNELECKIYPNPFMESTTIYFSEFQQRTISIMDITGRKLKTINSFNMQIEIKGYNMKKGMYFIQISDGEKQTIKKIILN